MRIVLSLFGALLLSTQLQAAEENTPPYQWTAAKLSAPIVIDGKLDEAIWQSVETSKTFVFHENNLPFSKTTWAKVAYDDEALYIAFYAEDADIAANYSQQDDPTYETDDVVEVFLDPDGDGKNGYLHSEVGSQI